PLCPLRAHRRSRRVPVHLHRDDGHHGDQRRQGHARRSHRRWSHLWPAAGGTARRRHQARGAVDDLRGADDPRRLLPARGHRTGGAALVAGARRRERRHGGRAARCRGGAMTNGPVGPELAVDGLTIRFGGLTAVEGLTFEVRAGEVLSLIGPNGAGKTSAFNAITGYIEAAAGDITYRGRRLNGLKPNAIAELGLVRTFQKTSVFTGQTVHDNVAIGLHLRSRQKPLAILLGLPSVAREERELAREAADILRFVGLEARVGMVAASLPYGELRLLEVAIALAARPKLLLLDEPVSGMNPTET